MLDDPPAKLALVATHRENTVPNKERQHILFKYPWSIPPNCPCIAEGNNKSKDLYHIGHIY